MVSFEQFEQDMQDTLNHLHDPVYPISVARLCVVLGCDAKTGTAGIRQRLLAAIEAMKPADDTPPGARSWRFYHLLVCRYVHAMTQDETAEHLNITPRHLRREQAQAVNALAQALWGDSAAPLATSGGQAPAEGDTEMLDQEAYNSQVKAELSALKSSAGGQGANMAATVRTVAELVPMLLNRYNVTLQVGEIAPSCTVNVNPSALRQILVQSISELARRMTGGVITLEVEQEADRVKITITGKPITEPEPIQDHLIRELIAVFNGTLAMNMENTDKEHTLTLQATLPSQQINVLVVDDNPDLVHFYHRYVQGTPYRITAIQEGSRIFEIIKELQPQLIVLDVMLPNVDGWELLAHLHAHPDTTDIPVIICSVVREEELALVLGAALYIAKPVRRQSFIQALDQAALRIQKNASIRKDGA